MGMTRDEFQAALLVLATGYLGRPYIWGGDDPIRGFDCSGLVQEVLASLGEDPPGDQTAQALYDHFGRRYPIEGLPAARAGGLAFFGSSKRAISHVGFCLSSELMLEAGGGGSATPSIEAAIAQNAYVRIRPIDRRTDLQAIIVPKYRIVQE
jgi:cell wall-associated NlpC family hydrolase